MTIERINHTTPNQQRRNRSPVPCRYRTRQHLQRHRLKSAEWLAALCGTIPEDAIPKSASIRPKPKSKPKQAKTDKQAKRDKKPPVTEKQILHFDIARAIMRQTRDGESIIEFLIRVVAKIERDGENFTPAASMRAARELLLRGFGNCIPGINRILSGKTEALDSHISKTIREYADYGMEPIRFLIDAMENEIPEIEPKSKDAFNFNKRLSQSVNKKRCPKGFTASQRVWAACELLRRAYDIKTDHITPADIQAYWNSQTPAVAYPDDGEPDCSKLGITREDVEAGVAKMRAADATKAAAASATAATEKPANNGNANNSTAPEKPAASNTTNGNTTPNRAERRRAKRAARKAQKRANNPVDSTNNADAAINHANEAPNPTETDAPATDDNADAPTSNSRPRLTRAQRRRIKCKNRKRPQTTAVPNPLAPQKPTPLRAPAPLR